MPEIIIALDNIRSHHNVGSIFRSADAFRIKEVILGGITPCPPHRDIQKTALGATLTVAWRHELDLEKVLLSMRAQGIELISVEQCADSVDIGHFSLEKDKKYCLIFGNEVDGVSPNILGISGKSIEIPQMGQKKSLNVSVCAGIVMFYFRGA